MAVITFMFCIVLSSSIGVITVFDFFIAKRPIKEILFDAMLVQQGTSQWMVFTVLLFGFAYSVGVDYRMRKKNKARSKKS